MIFGAMQDYALTIDKFIDHAAKWHPDAQVVTAIAAKDADGAEQGRVIRTNYAELREQAKRVSSVLLAKGVKVGDSVATLAWNTQAHLECWYGIMGMGAVCHTLNPRLNIKDLADMLAQSGARILIVAEDMVDQAAAIRSLANGIEHVFVIDTEQASAAASSLDVTDLKSLFSDAKADARWGEFDENSPCGLCFTSGTTGSPKGVTYTHRANYLHTMRQLQADVSGIVASDSILVAVPMFHANAWGLPFAAPAVGAKLVLPGQATTGEALAQLIAREDVTLAVAVPTLWLALYDYLDKSGMVLPSLKRIMVGGAAMPPALMRRIEASGVTLQTSWGMTELSPLGTAAVLSSMDRSPETVGRPAIGIDLMLADTEGRRLEKQRGTEGHLHARGHSVVERYFGNMESACTKGWFPTGDLAMIDDDGLLSITGRSKDLIKSGGEWINPAILEAHITALPGVAHAAVIARYDAKWGERPVLVLEEQGPDTLSDADILAVLSGKVARWWLPDVIERVKTMPLSSTGKIDKLLLRDQFSTAKANSGASGVLERLEARD